jgi:hypothetical protein
MTEVKDLLLRDAALSYALLRVALGLNICLHGVVRWSIGLTELRYSITFRTLSQSLIL